MSIQPHHIDDYLAPKSSLEFRQLRIGVVGCGNVGFNTLKAFYQYGHSVKAFDSSETALDKVRREFGESATASNLSDLIDCELIFVCLPTDPLPSGECDVSAIESVVANWANIEGSPNCVCKVLVQRSTCPPGTAERLRRSLTKTEYAVNPSFLSKATQWEDSVSPCRIAIGSTSLDAIDLLRLAYLQFPNCPEFISDSPTTVELLKYIENGIDSVLISVWNEFLQIAKASNISSEDFQHLCDSLTQRDRFATCLRVPGARFGLWCLPKDLQAIVKHYPNLRLNVLSGAVQTNLAQNAAHEGREPASDLYAFDDKKRIVLMNGGIMRINSAFKRAADE